MTEKSYYAKINKHYLSHSKEYNNNIVWEAKFTRTSRIAYRALANHQEESLVKAQRAYAIKLADVGLALKPFDGGMFYKASGFFIAIYFTYRKTIVVEIPIDNFLHEKYSSKEKSLTKQRALEIGKVIPI